MNYKKYVYKIEQNVITIEQFIRRYHFEDKDKELLLATGRFLSEINEVEAWIGYGKDQVTCIATLGERYDRLLDVVMESQHLLMAYSLECFAMEFLSKTYERMNETVYEETGKWMGEYHFIGDEEMIKKIVCGKNLEGDSSALSVSWEKGMLRPLKSVIFTAEYRDKREESGCYDCEKCDNLTCTFRQIITKNVRKPREVNVDAKSVAYSYGISQIFSGGKQGEEV